ncbi:MAG: urease accessory protein UreD [Microbacterium pygmaeum]
MSTTRIAVTAGVPRAHIDLVVGALAPRLIDRAERRARVALTAAGMLLLGGDRVHIRVDVGAGCTLDLEDVGGTVAYPTRGVPSEWIVDIDVGAGGVLRWHGLPFVLAAGADVRRRTTIFLQPQARALVRETLVLGRHAETGGHLRSSFDVADAGGPVLCETLEIDGVVPEPGVLGDARAVDSVIAAGFRPPSAPGHLVLDQPGAIARHLGGQSHESDLEPTWTQWSATLEHASAAVSPDRGRVSVR